MEIKRHLVNVESSSSLLVHICMTDALLNGRPVVLYLGATWHRSRGHRKERRVGILVGCRLPPRSGTKLSCWTP